MNNPFSEKEDTSPSEGISIRQLSQDEINELKIPPDKCGICGEEANHFRGNEAFCMKHYFEEREKEADRDIAEQKVKDFQAAINLPPRCESCKHKYEEKMHPLEKKIKEVRVRIENSFEVGVLDKGQFRRDLKDIRYESIKWAWEENHNWGEDVNEFLTLTDHEDWIP